MVEFDYQKCSAWAGIAVYCSVSAAARLIYRPEKSEVPTLTKTGVGARLRRREDDRFLQGRGQYIADIRFAGMREVAFVRSPVAHARLIGVRIPEHLRAS